MHGLSSRELINRASRLILKDSKYWLKTPDKKPLGQQFRECRALYRTYKTLPVQYLKHDLFRRTVLGDYLDYVPNTLAEAFIKSVNPAAHFAAVDDKELFTRHMAANNIPVVDNLLIVRAAETLVLTDQTGTQLDFDAALAILANTGQSDFFMKPVNGSQGSGTMKVALANQQLMLNNQRLDADSLRTLLARSTKEGHYLIQPFVAQHQATRAFNPGSLNTLRVVTMAADDGVQLVGAAFRMGVATMVTDNRSAGGIAIGINLEDGSLHQFAIGDSETYGANRRLSTHPDSQICFKDFSLPYWKEVQDIALAAAVACKPLKVIGWDIAITPTGPIAIEANSNPEILLLQIAGGILRTPLGTELSQYYGWEVPSIAASK